MAVHKGNDVIREELEGTDITAVKKTTKRNGYKIRKECRKFYIKAAVLM
jgi:hypothetical protein